MSQKDAQLVDPNIFNQEGSYEFRYDKATDTTILKEVTKLGETTERRVNILAGDQSAQISARLKGEISHLDGVTPESLLWVRDNETPERAYSLIKGAIDAFLSNNGNSRRIVFFIDQVSQTEQYLDEKKSKGWVPKIVYNAYAYTVTSSHIDYQQETPVELPLDNELVSSCIISANREIVNNAQALKTDITRKEAKAILEVGAQFHRTNKDYREVAKELLESELSKIGFENTNLEGGEDFEMQQRINFESKEQGRETTSWKKFLPGGFR